MRERFLVPPFSLLDARQGYWRDRKKHWVEMGLDGGETRHEMQTTGSLSGTDPTYYKQKGSAEKELGRRLTNAEFEMYHYMPHENSRLMSTKSGGILSLFDPVLAEIAYRWFCPPDGKVLDPFAGGPTRGAVAARTGRRYIGIDLRRDQVEANRRCARRLKLRRDHVSWRTGDASDVKKLAPGSYDFLFTCPPYADLERYSDNPRDLSNMRYDQFVESYRRILADASGMLKDDRFACIVVGDVRDKRSGCYRNFVSHTITAMIDAGLQLYNEAILATATGSLAVRALRPFELSRKLGKSHQNVLVFVKGDPRKAAAAVGPVRLDDVAGSADRRQAKRWRPESVHAYHGPGPFARLFRDSHLAEVA